MPRRNRCGCSAVGYCVDHTRMLAQSEGRAIQESGWSAAPTSSALQNRILFTHLPSAGGWRGFHVHDSRKSAPGFPDLVLLRTATQPGETWRPRHLVAELKNAGEHPTRDQQQWLEAFWLQGVEVYIWMPNDEPAIVETLRTERVGDRSTQWLDRLGFPCMLLREPLAIAQRQEDHYV